MTISFPMIKSRRVSIADSPGRSALGSGGLDSARLNQIGAAQ
jgi:hypothetical protein